MIDEHQHGSVWNVAMVAIGLFVAVVIVAGIISPGDVTLAVK